MLPSLARSLAKQAMCSKQAVRLSAYAHEVLMHFLHSSPTMLPLLGIVNKCIKFEVGRVILAERDAALDS